MVNKVILIGRAGNAPLIRDLGQNKSGKLSIATSERFTNRNGEKVETTEWHNVQLWDKLAEVAEKYIIKGTLVYVEGKLKTEKYTDSQGAEKFYTNIVASKLQLLGKREADGGVNDDDLPD